MSRSSPADYSVRAATRVLDILDVLRAASDGMALNELAEAASLPKSSAFRYLHTLESRGYVERDTATGTYRLGAVFLASKAHHLQALVDRARPVLERLRDRFDETTNLGVLDGSRVLYLEIVESRRGTRFAARKRDREPLHSTALGKAIASLLSDDEVRAILKVEGMAQRTTRTITDPERFLHVIQAVRREGYALDDRENEEDGRCVAVPVRGARVPAAMSLSAPAPRFSMPDATAAATALQQAAADLRRELGAET